MPSSLMSFKERFFGLASGEKIIPIEVSRCRVCQKVFEVDEKEIFGSLCKKCKKYEHYFSI